MTAHPIRSAWCALGVVLPLILVAGCHEAMLPGEEQAAASLAEASQTRTAPTNPGPGASAPASENDAPAATDSRPPAAPVTNVTASGPAALRDITFDDLKFEMEKEDPFKRSMLTPAIEKLSGNPIRIRGYILPSFQQRGITHFVLVRDNMECCFGPGAALFDCIAVEMESGKTIEYTIRPVAVDGLFSIREFVGPDGKHLAIYHLVASSVGPA